MNSFGISQNITETTKALYAKSESAVLMETNIGDSLTTSMGIRHGCPISPILFNNFLKLCQIMIMSDYVR